MIDSFGSAGPAPAQQSWLFSSSILRKMTIPLVLLAVVQIFTGCAYWGNRTMDTLYYNQQGSKDQKQLIVFLRGMGGSHEDFERYGLVKEVVNRNLPFAMAAPNAHFGYYSERTLVERLHADVIQPAYNAGYRDIWLVGVSMGGLGSLLYLREYPEHIKGVVLISPFLGYRQIVDEINNSGGVKAWQPGPYDADDDWQRMLWDWIKKDVAAGKSVPVYVGCGRDDRYLYGTELLSSVLPDSNSAVIDGKHDYPTFIALWNLFLERQFYLP